LALRKQFFLYKIKLRIFFLCSAASQTDLCSENFPIGAREMAKLRLKYDEWRKRVKEIQEKLAALEERVSFLK
jgi:hypothetical protein